jgi:NTE family protein
MGQVKISLSMSGGGARAAYQVGVLKYIAKNHPDFFPSIITGVSAGAVNAAHIAAHQGDFKAATDDLYQLWQQLQMQNVFKVSSLSLIMSFLRWGARFMLGGSHFAPKTKSLLDCSPLRGYLSDVLKADANGLITGIDQNIQRKRLQVLGITTSSYTMGQSITWTHGYNPDPWVRPTRISVDKKISIEHIMASAALPLVFPAVNLDGQWHGDGGIRLIAPLSASMHYGADKILAITTRRSHTDKMKDMEPMIDDYPPTAQIIGSILNAVFLDVFDHDAANMQRLNNLYEYLPAEQQAQLNRTEVLVMRPSQDLAKIAHQLELKLPSGFRYFVGGFGTKETKSPDSLSMLMFFPEYITRLMELGEADAEAQHEKIEKFLLN